MKVGRVGFREEGDFWNAYWMPKQDSAEGAILLGSLRLSLVKPRDPIYRGFMALMQDASGRLIEEVAGEAPTWGKPRVAPEGDRSGSA